MSTEDLSHAEAFNRATGGNKDYDKFYVHGWMDMLYDGDKPIPRSLQVILDRVIPPVGKFAEDAIDSFATRLVSMGAPPTTQWSTGFGPKVLSEEFPQLFKKRRRKAA